MGRDPGASIRGLRAPSQAPAVAQGPTLAPCLPMAGAHPCPLTRPSSLQTGPEGLAQQCTEIKTRLSTIRTSLPRATRPVGPGHSAVRPRGASLGVRGPVQCSLTTTTTRRPVATPLASTSTEWGPHPSVCPRLL